MYYVQFTINVSVLSMTLEKKCIKSAYAPCNFLHSSQMLQLVLIGFVRLVCISFALTRTIVFHDRKVKLAAMTDFRLVRQRRKVSEPLVIFRVLNLLLSCACRQR